MYRTRWSSRPFGTAAPISLRNRRNSCGGAAGTAGDDRVAGQVKRGEEAGRAVADVVVCHPGRGRRQHQKPWNAPWNHKPAQPRDLSHPRGVARGVCPAREAGQSEQATFNPLVRGCFQASDGGSGTPRRNSCEEASLAEPGLAYPGPNRRGPLGHRLGSGRAYGRPVRENGWTWHILADPDGNEFCVMAPPDACRAGP